MYVCHTHCVYAVHIGVKCENGWKIRLVKYLQYNNDSRRKKKPNKLLRSEIIVLVLIFLLLLLLFVFLCSSQHNICRTVLLLCDTMWCDTITIAMAIDFCLPAPYIVWKPHWKLSWAIHISNQSYQRWQKFPFVIVNNAIAEAIALMPSMVLRKWNYKFFIQDILEFVSFYIRCCSNELFCDIFHWLNWNVFFFFRQRKHYFVTLANGNFLLKISLFGNIEFLLGSDKIGPWIHICLSIWNEIIFKIIHNNS